MKVQPVATMEAGAKPMGEEVSFSPRHAYSTYGFDQDDAPREVFLYNTKLGAVTVSLLDVRRLVRAMPDPMAVALFEGQMFCAYEGRLKFFTFAESDPETGVVGFRGDILNQTMTAHVPLLNALGWIKHNAYTFSREVVLQSGQGITVNNRSTMIKLDRGNSVALRSILEQEK